MPILIVNITNDPQPTGVHEYEVRINRTPKFRFKHRREEPLSECLRLAYEGALRYECNEPIEFCEKVKQEYENENKKTDM
ncbi:MAG TPA: hypothetical protein VMX17_03855 [Candidatus Glassbacteria bacterium]|nr:hypothetical protein [Candidatus Glassbacteria bacterium]